MCQILVVYGLQCPSPNLLLEIPSWKFLEILSSVDAHMVILATSTYLSKSKVSYHKKLRTIIMFLI